MIAFLASVALSPWALGAGLLIAIAATAGLVYIRAPASLIAIVWLVFAAHLYSGTIWQTATEACESRVAAAVAAEQLRQNAVRAKALDNAVTRELAARADANEAEQKVAAYEATLANPQPAVADANGNCPPRFILGADDVRALGVLQR